MASLRPPPHKDRSAIVIEDIETEAERQFKELVKKQLSTDVSLQQQLDQRRDFRSGVVYHGDAEETKGERSLAEFKRISHRQQRLNDLLSCGLTPHEAQIKLQSEEDNEDGTPGHEVPSKRFKSSGSAAVLNKIEQKIRQKESDLQQPTSFAAAKTLSRHEMDLEKSITRHRKQADHLHCLVVKDSSSLMDHKYPHPKHPMNDIKAILKGVDGESDGEGETEGFIGPAPKPEGFVSSPLESEDGIGPWVPVERSKLRAILASKPKCEAQKKRDGTEFCALKADCIGKVGCFFKSTESENGVRILDGGVTPVPLDVMDCNRLTLEEIRAIPRFHKYEPGLPSETLFVKNLPPSLTESEFAALFLELQEDAAPKIVFRLMSGRMNGQAFVKFHSTSAAEKAMTHVNGFKIKGKPMILQYGRKMPSSAPTDGDGVK